MLRVTINGQEHEFPDGLSVLNALTRIDVEVPTLCNDERLEPYGGCRLCIVDVKGAARPLTACTTPLVDGMRIETHTPEIETLRRTLLQLLASQYPPEALLRSPDSEFHRYLREYALERECAGHGGADSIDDSNPYIHVDMSQCVYCYRCVRICDEVQGQFVWRVWNRGDRTAIKPDSGSTLMASSCVSCGACADTCPSGAIEDKNSIGYRMPDSWTRTTCPYCGTGCEMNVGIRDGAIATIRPVMDAPVSRGHLCVKGRYAFEYVYAPDRVTQPMLREGRGWRQVSWDEAINFTARELERILKKNGPHSIGILGSARATNEENYLAQKFARAVIGTNNIDCCARVCHAPTATAMKLMLGAGAATNSFDDIERARTLLICGSNTTENHPIVGARIKQAKLAGANLIVIDPRKIELAEYADIHLQLRPGTNIPLLNAMCNVIVQQELFDPDFITERVSEWNEFRSFIQQWTPERAASICSVDPAAIRKAAGLYASSKPSMMFHGLGVTEHTQGTKGVMCLVNLALLTGNIGKPGTGINPLRGQNNVQGAAHMGCEPGNLTGYVAIEQARSQFEALWQTTLPMAPGLNLMEMMGEAAAGELKALWAIGYDVLLTNPDANETRRALAKLELLIVQDMFLNETAREFANVFLPAASAFEKDGTFMNAERRIQLVRKAINSVGGSRPDWEIICLVARTMSQGHLFGFQSAEEIWNEVRSVWPAGAGITHDRLEQAGLQWPCPTEEHEGTAVLHAKTFPNGQRAALRLIDDTPPAERVDEEFPFLLNTGRTLYQFNAGTMTRRTPNFELHGTDKLEISVTDARSLGIVDGQHVRVLSRHGQVVLQAQVGDAVSDGELFATFHDPAVFLNLVTSSERDALTDTPAYKYTPVRVELL